MGNIIKNICCQENGSATCLSYHMQLSYTFKRVVCIVNTVI